MPRLSLTTLDQLPAEVSRPPLDPRDVGIGSVHLGIGAFHRAHQAVFTEDAMAATGEAGWGICGVTQRSPRVVEQLRPQDGLYGVLQKGLDDRGEADTSMRVVGAVRDVAYPGQDTARVLAHLAAPTTHLVTLTVTEKGYYRGRDGIDLGHPNVQADLAALTAELAGQSAEQPASTPVGMLTRGLARRYLQEATPMSVVTCDNIVDNGAMLAGLIASLVRAVPDAGGAGLLDWLAGSVRFPSTMVDRIVPATGPEHREEARALSGLEDQGLVVAEPFNQWVVEDDFAGPRPRWERAGVTMTDDVAPWEQAKLRMLNGPHSYLAYRGVVLGHRSIAEAMGDPRLEAELRAMIDEDVVPTLSPPADLDLAEYRESILERFANPHTGHTTIQVTMDGSQKLPVRVLGTAADRIAAGQVPHACARAVAAWMVFVARRRTVDGTALVVDDPFAERLKQVAAGEDAGLADRMLGLREVFPPEVAEDPGFRQAVRENVRDLLAELG